MTIIVAEGALAMGQQYECGVVTSLSSFFREWAAVQSIRSPALMPLASYLLKALPVISVANFK
jgi:hypothetical protein